MNKNLKKAKHKLAIAKTLHSRLGDDSNLNPDIMQNVIDHLSTMEINPNYSMNNLCDNYKDHHDEES